MSRPLRLRAPASLLAPLVVVTWGAHAAAQSTNGSSDATRRDLIQQAQTEAEAGRHAHALELATHAGDIRMSPPLRRMIAEEQEALAHYPEALAAAQTCVAESQADTTVPNRRAHLAACNAIVARVQQHVGRVVLRVPADVSPERVHVEVAHGDVARALWGVPYVVSAGLVVVDVRAEGFDPFHVEVRVPPAGSVEVPIALHAVVASHVETPVAPVASRRTSSGPPWVPLALGAGGVAVVGLAVGIVGNAVYQSAATGFNGANCYVRNGVVQGDAAGSTFCTDHYNAGHTWQPVAITGYVTAGVFAAAAGTFLVLSQVTHPRADAAAQAMCAPSIGDTMGFHCRVVF